MKSVKGNSRVELINFTCRSNVAMGYKLQSLGGKQQTLHKSQFNSLCTMDLILYIYTYIQQAAIVHKLCLLTELPLSEQYYPLSY
jgi:hypothetical protein